MPVTDSNQPPLPVTVVSVDVEDWYHGPTAARLYGTRDGVAGALAAVPDPERGLRYLDPVLALLAARGIRATFFWVAEYARRFPDGVRRCAAAGHEIACHGLTHFPKFDPATRRPHFTPDEFRARTTEAKRILEDLAGRPVTGYRAPNAYIAGWMLDALEALGFTYDSSVSVNSLYNKTDAPRLDGVDTRPYAPRRGSLLPGTEPRGIVEFPWPYLRLGPLRVQSAGGPYLRFFGAGMVRAGLRQSLRRGPTVFYFHPVDLCREPIPLPFSWRRPMLWWFKGDLVRHRVERVLDTLKGRTTAFEDLRRRYPSRPAPADLLSTNPSVPSVPFVP